VSNSAQFAGAAVPADAAAAEGEVDQIPVGCAACRAAGAERLHVTTIPHFGEVVVRAFSCETSEVPSSPFDPLPTLRPLFSSRRMPTTRTDPNPPHPTAPTLQVQPTGPGSGPAGKGVRLALRAAAPLDRDRLVLRSHTTAVSIPEAGPLLRATSAPRSSLVLRVRTAAASVPTARRSRASLLACWRTRRRGGR